MGKKNAPVVGSIFYLKVKQSSCYSLDFAQGQDSHFFLLME